MADGEEGVQPGCVDDPVPGRGHPVFGMDLGGEGALALRAEIALNERRRALLALLALPREVPVGEGDLQILWSGSKAMTRGFASA